MAVSSGRGGSGGGQPIVQRISLTGAEEVKRLLENMGTAGERAAAQIGAAMAASGGNTAALGTAVETAFTRIGTSSAQLKPVHENLREMHGGVGRFGGSLSQLADVIMPNLTSKVGMGIGGLALGMKELLGSANKSILDLRNMSIESGNATEVLLALKNLFENTGVPVEKLGMFVSGFSDKMATARNEAKLLNGPLGSPFEDASKAVQVLRGNVDQANNSMDGSVTVMRGAQVKARDLSTAFKSLGMDAQWFKGHLNDPPIVVMQEYARRLLAVKDIDEQVRIGTDMSSKAYKILAAGILEINPKLAASLKEVRDKGLAPTKDDEDRALKYNTAVHEMGGQWERTVQQMGSAVFPLFTEMAARTEESIGIMRGLAEAFSELIVSAVGAMNREWGTNIDLMKLKAFSFRDAVNEAIRNFIPGLNAALKLLDRVRDGSKAGGEPGFDPNTGLPFVSGGEGATGPPVGKSIAEQIDFANAAGDQSGRYVKTAPAPSGYGPIVASAELPSAGAFTAGQSAGGPPEESAVSTDTRSVRPVEEVNWDFVKYTSPFYAGGGPISGPGGVDRVPLWGTRGEFMHRVAAVQHYGLDFMHKLNRLEIPRYEMGGLVDSISGMQRLAGGGMVGTGAGGGHSEFTVVLDNTRFSMSADRAVADSFLRTAIKEKVLRNGREPGGAG